MYHVPLAHSAVFLWVMVCLSIHPSIASGPDKDSALSAQVEERTVLALIREGMTQEQVERLLHEKSNERLGMGGPSPLLYFTPYPKAGICVYYYDGRVIAAKWAIPRKR